MKKAMNAPIPFDRLEIAKRLMPESKWQEAAAEFSLSARELAVAQMLLIDCSRDQIANTLRKSDGSSISPETVRVYIDRLYRKLSVESGVQMVLRLVDFSLSQERETASGCHKFCDTPLSRTL